MQTHAGAAAADERRQARRPIEAATRDLIAKLLKAHLTLPLNGRARRRPVERAVRVQTTGHFIDHGPFQRFVR